MFSRHWIAAILLVPVGVACSSPEEEGTTGDDQNVTGATCKAIPRCDGGDEESKNACTSSEGASCYPKTLCRSTIYCRKGGGDIEVEGSLKRVVEFGGLSISSEIHTSNEKFVLELGDEYPKFREGQFAKVSGLRKTVNDVEGNGVRPAIQVKKLLACPDSQINCKPPIAPSNTACGADRAWIEAKCPGADFLD